MPSRAAPGPEIHDYLIQRLAGLGDGLAGGARRPVAGRAGHERRCREVPDAPLLLHVAVEATASDVEHLRHRAAEGADARPVAARGVTREHLPRLEKALRQSQAAEMRLQEMAQGQKKSRVVAWRF